MKQTHFTIGDPLPPTGFLRLPQVLALIPVSKSTWWDGCKEGIFPKSVTLGKRTTAWKVEDIVAYIQSVGHEDNEKDSA